MTTSSPSTEPSTPTTGPARFLLRLAQRRGPSTSVGDRRRLLAVAAVVFVIATVFAARRLPPVDTHLRLWLIALVPLAGVPLTAMTNAWEYRVTARLVGHDVAFWPAVRVAVLSTAANLLPIPGAMLVRTKALRDGGSSLGGAVGATAGMGVAWIGVTFTIAGLLHLAIAGEVLGGAIAIAGAMVTAMAVSMLARLPGARHDRRLLGTVVLVESAGVTVNGARFMCVLWGLGYDVSVAQAIALTVSGVLASATGFFPGGLGLRELLAGIISPAVGLPVAVGVVASSIDRISGMAMLGALSLVLSLRSDATPDPTSRDGDPDT